MGGVEEECYNRPLRHGAMWFHVGASECNLANEQTMPPPSIVCIALYCNPLYAPPDSIALPTTHFHLSKMVPNLGLQIVILCVTQESYEVSQLKP